MVPWDGLIELMDERVAVDVGAQSGPELCAGVLAARRLRELADLLEVHWLGELAARDHTDAEYGMPAAQWFAAQASLPTGVTRAQASLADGSDAVSGRWMRRGERDGSTVSTSGRCTTPPTRATSTASPGRRTS